MLARDDARVPLADQYRLWEIATAATRRTLPIEIASMYEVGTYDALGFACSTAENVEEAYNRLGRFIGLWVTGEWVEILPEPGGKALIYHHDLPRSFGRDLAAESAIAKIAFAARHASGADVRPYRIELAHDAPDDRAAFEKALGAAISFNSPRYALHWDDAALKQPMLRADPELASFFERHAEELLSKSGAAGSSAGAVRRAVAEILPSGDLAEAMVARRLGWSDRTLRRRLREDGASFRDVVDDVRRSMAMSYLLRDDTNIRDVAFLVGFADVSNFYRAFRRWTGGTPAEWRRSRAGN